MTKIEGQETELTTDIAERTIIEAGGRAVYYIDPTPRGNPGTDGEWFACVRLADPQQQNWMPSIILTPTEFDRFKVGSVRFENDRAIFEVRPDLDQKPRHVNETRVAGPFEHIDGPTYPVACQNVLREVYVQRAADEIRGTRDLKPFEHVALLTEATGTANAHLLKAMVEGPKIQDEDTRREYVGDYLADYREMMVRVAAIAVEMIETLDRQMHGEADVEHPQN